MKRLLTFGCVALCLAMVSDDCLAQDSTNNMGRARTRSRGRPGRSRKSTNSEFLENPVTPAVTVANVASPSDKRMERILKIEHNLGISGEIPTKREYDEALAYVRGLQFDCMTGKVERICFSKFGTWPTLERGELEGSDHFYMCVPIQAGRFKNCAQVDTLRRAGVICEFIKCDDIEIFVHPQVDPKNYNNWRIEIKGTDNPILSD